MIFFQHSPHMTVPLLSSGSNDSLSVIQFLCTQRNLTFLYHVMFVPTSFVLSSPCDWFYIRPTLFNSQAVPEIIRSAYSIQHTHHHQYYRQKKEHGADIHRKTQLHRNPCNGGAYLLTYLLHGAESLLRS